MVVAVETRMPYALTKSQAATLRALGEQMETVFGRRIFKVIVKPLFTDEQELGVIVFQFDIKDKGDENGF